MQAAQGQQPPATNSTCRRLLQIASMSLDAAVRSRGLAYCGPDGRAVEVQLIRRGASHRDESFLRDLVAAADVKDPAIFSAAIDLAQNRSATVESRVAGLDILVRQLFGMQSGVAVPDNTPPNRMTDQTHCLVVGATSASNAPGDEARLRSMTESIMQDPTQPPAVRAVSRCVRERLAPAYVPSVDTTKLHFSTACAGGIRIRPKAGQSWLECGRGCRGRAASRAEPVRRIQVP